MQYIGKAFSTLTDGGTVSNPNGIYLAGHLASHLSEMSEDEVNKIESGLNFNPILVRMKPTGTSMSTSEIVELRRVAQLIKLCFTPLKKIPDQTLQAQNRADDLRYKGVLLQKWDQAELWDEAPLKEFNSAFRQLSTSKPSGAGMYLAPSFWAFSKLAERQQAQYAWTEANTMWTAGKRVLQRAYLNADNLYTKWFGTAPRPTVQAAVDKIGEGLSSSRISLGYAGMEPGAAVPKIVEEGFSSASVFAEVKSVEEWGSGKIGNPIILGRRFFDPNQTTGLRTVKHEETSNSMGVSRGGAILHEAGHAFAGIHDEECSNAVYVRLNRPPPVGNAERAKGYGTLICHAMAAAAPNSAATNADCYRLFFEDAYVLFPH